MRFTFLINGYTVCVTTDLEIFINFNSEFSKLYITGRLFLQSLF